MGVAIAAPPGAGYYSLPAFPDVTVENLQINKAGGQFYLVSHWQPVDLKQVVFEVRGGWFNELLEKYSPGNEVNSLPAYDRLRIAVSFRYDNAQSIDIFYKGELVDRIEL